jgi:putative ABC transport system permease protein
MERVQVLPGVKQVSLARRAPLSLSGGGATQQVHVPGDQSPPGEHVRSIKYTVVGLNYFRTMGTRILRGRDFNERDDELGANVVLISETMARWFWPNEDPMGKIIRVKGPKETDWQIIGVVEDTKINSIRETAEPYLSFPFGQMFSGEMTLLVETVGDPTDLVADIRREIHRFDKNVPVLSIMTLKQLIRFGLYAEQLIATLVGLLGVIGLILATVGLYGVISYLVNSRRHEIGVRVALGAERRDIFKLVLRQGLKLVLIGLGIGLAGAGAAARFLAAMLSGVTATDPVTFTGVPALLVVVALMACYIPACRATKVDPVVALRCE